MPTFRIFRSFRVPGVACVMIGACLATLATLRLDVQADPTVAADSDVLAPDVREYREYCRDIADQMLGRIFRDPSDWVHRQRKLDCISHAALVQARLWQWTNEAKYADGANRFLLEVAKARSSIREADFFTVYPFAKTYQILDGGNKLHDQTRFEASEFILQRFRARDVADHNQAFTRACGLQLAAQLFPNAKQAPTWRKYAEAVWNGWIAQGDITENAPNYNRIDSVYVFLLGDLLNRTDEMRAPSVNAMFRRWMLQIGPSGTIPAYGDSGAGRLHPDPNWPRRHAWGQWVAGFERAATFYQQGEFRWAAAKLYRRGKKDEPLGGRYFHVLALSAMMRTVDWTSNDLPPKTPVPRSVVLTRRDAHTPAALDKMVLTTGRQSGSPFLLGDLYNRGHHGHLNQHGGINWFESNNVPLIASLGYNNREPHHTNAFILRDTLGEFPHRRPAFAANQWQTSALPTVRMKSVNGHPTRRRMTELGLRVASQGGVTLWVDRLRLVGPGGERLIEGFEDPAGWNYNPHLTGHSTEGAFGLVWQFPPGAHTTFHRELNQRLAKLEFDCREFPQLLIDWKLSDNQEVARPLIVRCGVDFHAHTMQLQPQLLDASVQENSSRDQWGRLSFTDWFFPGASHTRRMVLTREGLLLVVDQFIPSSTSVGQIAGPVWHIGPLADPQTGPNWFNAVGAKRELLIYFAQAQDREFGFQTADVWSISGQRTVFAKQVVTSNPLTFVSLLLPHLPHESAKDLAAGVDMNVTADRVVVKLQKPFEASIELEGKSFRVDRGR